MSLSTRLKSAINNLLAPLNMRFDTLTAERLEGARLAGLDASGHFSKAAFPVLQQFKDCDPSAILTEVAKYESRFAEFATAPLSAAGYSLENDYYASPDAEVLYAIVRMHQPAHIVEIGSGNSTRLFRHAISDGSLKTRLTSIDPSPRCEIESISDEVIRHRVEMMSDMSIFSSLQVNDILFIDSSHEIKPGNDVLLLLLSVLPSLNRGVLVHLHDIFLPYDYPSKWMIEERWKWTEQYLVQALLSGNGNFEALWAGFYFQRTVPGFTANFKQWRSADARSLWLRRL